MIVLAPSNKRQQHHDYWLGGSTALVAGIVNVCSVIAFFAFASNVTGHVAVFAEEIVKGHLHQIGVVLTWLGCFLGGAFLANFLVTFVGTHAPRTGRGLALTLEILTLVLVGHYGHHHYGETLQETEYLVGLLLLAMGLQNGLVATVSNGVVKTTHVTGLLTDLGMELSMIWQKQFRGDGALRFKLKLHLLILGGYVGGGLIGGAMFLRFGFLTFFGGSAILASILLLDVLAARALTARRDQPTRFPAGAERDAAIPSGAP